MKKKKIVEEQDIQEEVQKLRKVGQEFKDKTKKDFKKLGKTIEISGKFVMYKGPTVYV